MVKDAAGHGRLGDEGDELTEAPHGTPRGASPFVATSRAVARVRARRRLVLRLRAIAWGGGRHRGVASGVPYSPPFRGEKAERRLTNFFALPYDCSVSAPYWGTLPDLLEVIALAELGKVKPAVEFFPLARVQDAYHELREGRIHGRAVIVPGGESPRAVRPRTGPRRARRRPNTPFDVGITRRAEAASP